MPNWDTTKWCLNTEVVSEYRSRFHCMNLIKLISLIRHVHVWVFNR